ncbi:30S ribosomal protein S4 [Oceanispirochaeta sp.]|jgi:small subunit ribosomal protein S4|uniref:30S ribosomal protein S4 n=1 Tax=Oceanispirochaeta sp. TaxID=2035350 RepID=UPI0026369DE1|nr:30S ribosomal protein S4 [Oceanispirochaeta sp.]MDA3958505.1 30S ribosomal protein S4 [Oceanispirochaeta sp.]
MARNSKAKGKIVRRLGVNIYGNSKYDKLLKKKPHGPGIEKGKRIRKKESDFGRQLVEKQKIRFAYGLSEKQFYNLFIKAKKFSGLSGDNMMILLEKRLDNVVYRLGLGTTRTQTRQLVSHGHIYVNGRRCNIPSRTLVEGDEVTVKDSEKSKKLVRESLARNNQSVPIWLTFSEDSLNGRVERTPYRTDIVSVANEQMVVEFYSR